MTMRSVRPLAKERARITCRRRLPKFAVDGRKPSEAIAGPKERIVIGQLRSDRGAARAHSERPNERIVIGHLRAE
jgi:hypothetical protein